jgi:putative transcriptional regulator
MAGGFTEKNGEIAREASYAHVPGTFIMKTSVGKTIIEGLKEFTEALEGGSPILEKFTCRKVTLDLQPIPYNPETVKATRSLLAASQALFAQFLGVSVKTVRGWEQGRLRTGTMACRFMDEIQRNPEYWRTRLRESIKVKTERVNRLETAARKKRGAVAARRVPARRPRS